MIMNERKKYMTFLIKYQNPNLQTQNIWFLVIHITLITHETHKKHEKHCHCRWKTIYITNHGSNMTIVMIILGILLRFRISCFVCLHVHHDVYVVYQMTLFFWCFCVEFISCSCLVSVYANHPEWWNHIRKNLLAAILLRSPRKRKTKIMILSRNDQLCSCDMSKSWLKQQINLHQAPKNTM